jgi:hypothetical protein
MGAAGNEVLELPARHPNRLGGVANRDAKGFDLLPDHFAGVGGLFIGTVRPPSMVMDKIDIRHVPSVKAAGVPATALSMPSPSAADVLRAAASPAD